MIEIRKILAVLSALFVALSDSARILAVFPIPSISHQLAFRPLVHELAKRGHEVVLVTPDPAFPKGKAPTNLTEIDVHKISYDNWQHLFESHTGDKKDILRNIVLMFELMTTTFEKQFQTPEVQKIIKEDNKFDLLLIEACVRTTIGLGHIFKVPIIQVSSFGAVSAQYNFYGAPIHPLLYPSAGRARIYNLTLWEKATEMFKIVFLEWLISTTEDFDFKMMKRNFGDDLPGFKDLYRNAQMLFLNEHHIWSDNHPVPPNIIYVGGMYSRPAQELPKDLKQYLDSSKNGVIYFSFGTNVIPTQLPSEKIQIMAKVLSQLPYDVLWKWNDDDVPIQSENIKFSKWFPQSDLLKHPNVKLFITQGGLQSTDEALNAGVPLLGVPMLGDQWYNVEKYVKYEFGKQLDLMSLTEEEFRDAIVSVIRDPSYKENAVKMQVLMKEHPIKPLDLAVWWVEHVIRFGGKHLHPPTYGSLSSYEYYEVPLILTVLAVVMIILALITFIIIVSVRFVRKNIKLVMKVKKS